MSDPVIVAFIAGGAAVLSGIVGAVAAVFSVIYAKRNAKAITEVHVALNSRLQQLIDASRHAGQIEERDSQRHTEKGVTLGAEEKRQ